MALASAALLLFNGLPASSGQESPYTELDLHEDARGYAEYQQYCSSCHGVYADGEGPARSTLETPPPSLRTLAARRGRALQRDQILEFIDGRKPIVAHGTREMPVWGDRFGEGVYTSIPEMRKRNMMMVIVDYLVAIQE